MWNKLTKQKKKAKLWVISGPSGSGKTTICDFLLKEPGINLTCSVSSTTRKPRKGEKNKKDYNFISNQDFLKKIKKGEFIEYEQVFGNYYGTSKKFINSLLEKGRDVLLSIDVKGAMQIRKKFPKNSVFIFVLPKNEKDLYDRIKKRAKDKKEDIKIRLKRVKQEISYAQKYDYILINDKLDKAFNELKSIIIAKRLENDNKSYPAGISIR